MPLKIGEFVLKNVNKFDDFTAHFSISNLRYAEHIKGFNPYDIFRQHLHSLGLSNCFVNKHLPKNRDNCGPALMPATYRQYKVAPNCTCNRGKTTVTRVFNLQIPLQKVRHLGASLERPITAIKKPIILQTEEEITTLLTLKLIVLTSFQ
jgi:hypothetical protein